MIVRLTYAIAVVGALLAGVAHAEPPPPPVKEVVSGRLAVGDALLPVSVSQDWSHPLPAVRRAVVIVHGFDRNAADYARTVAGLGAAPDVLVVAPQFPASEDIAANTVSQDVLHWQHDRWSSGYPAEGPQPASSFDALDAVLARLGDRTLFPNLANVVLAGFSAGGQLVQRYAIVGKGGLAFGAARLAIRMRFVVGSPSSFAYFTAERRLPDGTSGPFPGAASCPGYDDWKYGFAGALPPYVAAAAGLGIPGIERRYAERDVVYLVGANDNNTDARYLDKACAAEAQGASRLARTQAFFADLAFREGKALSHRLRVVDGAAHNAAKVLGSPCGRAALFGDEDCPANSGAEEKK
jgi:hypothetical protein